jgi:hypothetical protein
MLLRRGGNREPVVFLFVGRAILFSGTDIFFSGGALPKSANGLKLSAERSGSATRLVLRMGSSPPCGKHRWGVGSKTEGAEGSSDRTLIPRTVFPSLVAHLPQLWWW